MLGSLKFCYTLVIARSAWKNQFVLQQRTFQRKFGEFWLNTDYSRIAAHKSTRALACRKRHSETAVGSPVEEPQCRRPRVSLSQQDCWHHSLNSKRTSADISARSAHPLTVFDPVTEQEVAVLINKTPAKSCPLDPIQRGFSNKQLPV